MAPPARELVPFVPKPVPDFDVLRQGAEAELRDPKAIVRALEADPGRLSVEGHTPAEVLGFAQVLLRLDAVFLAERLLGQAVAKWPDDPDLAGAWGRVLVSLGRPEAARRAVAAALERRPSDATLHYLLGRALLGMEPRTPALEAQARAEFEKALALDPGFKDPDGVTSRELRAVIDRLGSGGAAPAGAP